MENRQINVSKAVNLQSIDELLRVDQIQYRTKLREYFNRVDVEEFNDDVMHDINGLKTNDEHFITRL